MRRKRVEDSPSVRFEKKSVAFHRAIVYNNTRFAARDTFRLSACEPSPAMRIARNRSDTLSPFKSWELLAFRRVCTRRAFEWRRPVARNGCIIAPRPVISRRWIARIQYNPPRLYTTLRVRWHRCTRTMRKLRVHTRHRSLSLSAKTASNRVKATMFRTISRSHAHTTASPLGATDPALRISATSRTCSGRV